MAYPARGELVEPRANGSSFDELRMSGFPLGLFFRFDDNLPSFFERQKLRRRCPDVGRREGAVAAQVLVEPVGVARLGEITVQLIRLAAEAAEALHAVVERRFNLVER